MATLNAMLDLLVPVIQLIIVLFLTFAFVAWVAAVVARWWLIKRAARVVVILSDIIGIITHGEPLLFAECNQLPDWDFKVAGSRFEHSLGAVVLA